MPRSLTTGQLLVAAIAIRLIWFFLDSQPRMFLGDSQSYLDTGTNNWYPDDRSWAFGIVLNQILSLSGSLSGYLLVQTLFSALAIAIVARFVGWLGASAAIQWTILALLSIEPLWVHYDRAMLTDSIGSSLLLMGLVGGIVAVMEGRSFLAVICGIALAAAISMRTALVPPVLLALMLFLLMGMKGSAGTSSKNRKLAAVSLVTVAIAGIAWYGAATGSLAKVGWSLNPRNGYFLVGPVAPILTPEDFSAAGFSDGASVLTHPRIKDRLWRNAQIYLEDGVMGQLERRLGDSRLASAVGAKAARNAVIRDPGAYAWLVVQQFGDYTNERLYRKYFDYWFGLNRPLTPAFQASIHARAWERVSADLPSRQSVTLAWVEQTLWYPPVLVWLALLLTVIAFWRALKTRSAHSLILGGIALISLGYLASICMFSAELVPRYLMPLAPIVLIKMVLIGQSFSRDEWGRG